jgi:methyl-accepting chemotaxis protein
MLNRMSKNRSAGMSRLFGTRGEEPDLSDNGRHERGVPPRTFQQRVWDREFPDVPFESEDAAREKAHERIKKLKRELAALRIEAQEMHHGVSRRGQHEHERLLAAQRPIVLRLTSLERAFPLPQPPEQEPRGGNRGNERQSASDRAIEALANVAEELAKTQKYFAEGDRDRLKDMAKLIEALKGVPASASGENEELREQFEALKKDIDEFKETADKNQRASQEAREAKESFEKIKKLIEEVNKAVEGLKEKEKELEEKAKSLEQRTETLAEYNRQIKVLDGDEDTEGSIKQAEKGAEKNADAWGSILAQRRDTLQQLPNSIQSQEALVTAARNDLEGVEVLVKGFRKYLKDALELSDGFNPEELQDALKKLQKRVKDAETALKGAEVAAQEAQTAFEKARDKVYAQGNEIVEEAGSLEEIDELSPEPENDPDIENQAPPETDRDFEDREPSEDFREAGERLR